MSRLLRLKPFRGGSKNRKHPGQYRVARRIKTGHNSAATKVYESHLNTYHTKENNKKDDNHVSKKSDQNFNDALDYLVENYDNTLKNLVER